MKNNSFSAFVTSFIVLAMAACARGQSTYSNAVMSLDPAGYWPMHEVEPAAQGDTETNYGTLGLLGTGYYPDWASVTPGVKRGAPGAIVGDSTDTSVSFTRGGNPAGGTYTNALYIPHNSPLTTLNPPFSVECWFFPTNLASDDIWAQCGDEGFNVGTAGGNAGSLAGIRLVWMDGTNTGFQIYNLNGAQNSVGFSGNTSGTQLDPTNNWYHLVVTCDAGTNFSLFVNGSQASLNNLATSNGPGSYTPDYWTPLTVGSGRGGTRACAGYIDEFAVYTNVIGDISTHYSDAINGSAGQYFHDVTNDNPVIYLRMDAPPAYTAPNTSAWPALANYGVTNGVTVNNGLYTPGTEPGVVKVPVANPNGVPFGGVQNNLTPFNGVSSFGDAGSAPVYNPTGSGANFTVTALFRGSPCDNRIQSIVGHGTNSWQLSITTNGCIVFNAGNGNKAAGGTGQAAGDIRTIGVYNDGNWHQVVAVNSTNVVSIYVDGVLDTNGTPAGVTPTSLIAGNTHDVLIGSDPTYTNIPPGVGRSFAGQVCEVAFFTNALSASQVQMLYNNCEVTPYITGQPLTGRAINGGPGTFINFGVTAAGSGPLAYQWYFNTSSNYSGATKMTDNGVHYVNSTSLQMTVTNLTANDSGYYYVVIANNYGSVTSILAGLTAYGAPNLLTQFPITDTNLFTLYAGASPTFSVAAGGAQPINYFWYTNGVLDGVAINASFTWTNVPAGTISNYCILTNAAGSATSMVWTASVLAAPTAPYPARVLALDPVAYWRLNEPDDGNGNFDGNDGFLCHDYAGGNDGIYTNMVLGQQGYSQTTDPSETAAFVGENNISFYDSMAEQIQGVDFAVTNGANGEFTVEAWANGYSSGQILGAPLVAKGLYGVDDQFNLGIDSTKTHYRFYVRAANGTIYVVGSGSAPALDGYWHHIVGVCDEANGLLSLYYDGLLVNTTAIPPNAGVYEDSEPITLGAGSGDGINYTNQFYGYMDDVAVYKQALTASNVAAQYFSLGAKPSASPSPPATTNVIGGGTLIVPAIAAGTPPSGYYWLDEDANTNVAAGTTNGLFLNATLTVSNVPGSWNGDTLELVLTNAYGSTTYPVALSVNTNAPQITLDLPSPVTVVSGQSYLYSIRAGSLGTVSYQWYNAGIAVPNQSNSTYIVTAGSPGNTTYFVVVTNIFGAATSSVSTFTSISATPPPLMTGYETNVLFLHPAGYWPMHEVEAAAPGDIEANYGTLGQLGDGFYPDWVKNYGGIVRQVPGALGDDTDTSDGFTFGTGNAGTTVSFTNGLYVPHTSPLTTLNPPFSVECWFYPTNTPTGEAVWSQSGAVGLNDGPLGSLVNFDGIMLNWANGTFVPYGYNGENTSLTANNGDKLESGGVSGGSPVEAVNHWYHVVVTCDATTNFTLYVNGSAVAGPTADVGKYAPDFWTPLSIGSGNGGLRSSSGSLDEFAVYTTNLAAADINTHYQDGTSGSLGAYFHDVTNDNPVIYLRMDAPPYSPPPTNFWPVLFNYGSAGGNGLYSPGTMPGIVAGPSTNAAGIPYNGLPVATVSQLSGVSSFADAGYAAAYNPTGATPFSVSAVFRGNPCDNRPQSIVSHSTNSWGIWMNTSGKLVCYLGTNSGSLTSSGVYNDGNWHQVVAVYAPSSNPNTTGTGAIYVDGVLDTSVSTVNINGIEPGSTLDVMIGSDPQLTNSPAGVGASFAGQICDVALFTNALTAGQIAALYVATETNNVPAYFAPAPPAGVTAATGEPLVVTAGVAGTDLLYYQWQFITNGGGADVLASGLTNGVLLNATLNVGSVPAAWTGGQLELTVTNAYGTNVALVALLIANPVNTSPTNIVFAVANDQLTLSWPADHTGWQLQAQTNSLAVGIGTNWVNISGSTTTNQFVIPINLTNGSVFYRLTY